jgi:hypothetical protein
MGHRVSLLGAGSAERNGAQRSRTERPLSERPLRRQSIIFCKNLLGRPGAIVNLMRFARESRMLSAECHVGSAES